MQHLIFNLKNKAKQANQNQQQNTPNLKTPVFS